MKATAQILALYFLLGSILPGADFGQLSKVPQAIEHYQLHQQLASEAGEDISLGCFIVEHFWSPVNHDHGDGGRSHQDLPLKHIHSFDHIAIQYFCPFVKTLQTPVVKLTIIAFECASCPEIGSIFRPPIFS
ncbi:hypothetical protein [Phaeodactylibacter luteus]|uniref:Uncharacterized protein n=1 Tax=Phaeodactylibacter luteus TaxID=1564516 RepID=A0A5C6RG86_9BACT|nr:hypothetical protein [Phaeodactylibacter luteus]TXB61307.1 hypothetical protein FRY97_19795 [Phaeodactylibacter luteus]